MGNRRTAVVLLLSLVAILATGCMKTCIEVVDGHGRPVPQATVQIDGRDHASPTDGHGKVYVGRLRGPTRVQARKTGMISDPLTIAPGAVQGGQPFRVVMQSLRKITARVVTDRLVAGLVQPVPVPGIQVSYRHGSGPRRGEEIAGGTTGPDGTTSFDLGADDDDEVTISAGGNGYSPAASPEPVRFDPLRRDLQVECRVLHEGRLTIEISGTDGDPLLWLGQVRIEGPPFRSVPVAGRSRDWFVQVLPGQTFTARVPFTQAAPTTKWVKDVSGGTCEWAGRDGGTLKLTFADAGTSFKITLSPPGSGPGPPPPPPGGADSCSFTIDCSPCRAQLWIDGISYGTTPARGRVAAGPHKVEFEGLDDQCPPRYRIAPLLFPSGQWRKNIPLTGNWRDDCQRFEGGGQFQQAIDRALEVRYGTLPAQVRDYREARLHAAALYSRRIGNKLKARDALRDAATQMPNDPEIALAYGIVLREIAQYDEAISQLQNAFGNQGNLSGEARTALANTVRYNLARCYDAKYTASNDTMFCLDAVHWYIEFLIKVNAGDPDLGDKVSEAQERKAELSGKCGQ